MSAAGRVAVIAGIGNCISDAIARRFVEAGARVALGGKDPHRHVKEAEEFRGWQPEPRSLVGMEPADLSGADALVKAALELHDRVDIAVSAWDEPSRSRLDEAGESEAQRILSVNLNGSLALARAAAGHMKRQRYGRIIHLSSRDWLGGAEGAIYGAARAGVVGFTRGLAWELVQYGITVNCVAPGVIDGDELRQMAKEEVEELLRMQPIRRAGAPAEVAEAALFFAADEAGYITGQTLYVCGGKSAFSALSA